MANKLSAICLIALIIICGGCAKRTSYKPKPIRPLKEHQHVDYQATQEQVTLRVKVFTAEDCKEIFEDRANRLNDIIPLQISVENNNGEAWLLHPKNIALNRETIAYMTKRLGSSCNPFLWALATLGTGLLITTAFGVPLYLLGGIAYHNASIPAALFFGIPTIIGMIMIYATPIGFIAGCVAGAHANGDLAKYLKETAVGTSIAIAPNMVIDRLLFIRSKNYQQQFDILLTNGADDKNLLFSVTLPVLNKAV